MKATIAVIPEANRESSIQQTDPSGGTARVPFRGANEDYPIRTILIDTPVYRMANIRTKSLHDEYVIQNGKPADYFDVGQEDPTVQQIQHEFLVDLAKADVADIYNALASGPDRSEPLVITTKGVVLNGNRRLAAMRELRATDPARFARFSHIQVVVLPPDAKEADLIKSEVVLQIRRDLKLPYGWIDEAIALKEQLAANGNNFAALASVWEETQPSLKLRLKALELADEYLVYAGRPGQRRELEGDEQVFATLAKKQTPRGVSVDPSRLELERYVVFASIGNKAIARGRLYDVAARLGDVTEGILKTVEPLVSEDPGTSLDPTDPLAALTPAAGTVSQEILGYVRDPGHGADIAVAAADRLDVLDLARRANVKGGALLAGARSINGTASSLTVAGADPATVDQAAGQLVAALATEAHVISQLVQAHPRVAAGIDKSLITTALEVLAKVEAQLDTK